MDDAIKEYAGKNRLWHKLWRWNQAVGYFGRWEGSLEHNLGRIVDVSFHRYGTGDQRFKTSLLLGSSCRHYDLSLGLSCASSIHHSKQFNLPSPESVDEDTRLNLKEELQEAWNKALSIPPDSVTIVQNILSRTILSDIKQEISESLEQNK